MKAIGGISLRWLLVLGLFSCEIRFFPVCGDGIVDRELGEECDDFNNINADGCEANCTLPACGNGIVDPGELCLLEQKTFPTGLLPAAVTVDDFSDDGILDLAVANFDENTAGILLGDGFGDFFAQETFATGELPVALDSGDVSGDGFSDLVVANQSTLDVSVLLGLGDGTFLDEQRLATQSAPVAVVLDDVSEDNSLDIITANFVPVGVGTVSVLLGSGEGSFQAQTPFEAGPAPSHVAAGDVSGDGFSDLVVTNFLDEEGGDIVNTVSVLLGNGDGSFQPPNAFLAGSSPSFVVIEDFSGDLLPDLAVASLGDNTLSLLFGDGEGAFSEIQSLSVGLEPVAIAVGDINLDGFADIVTANSGSNDIDLLLGKGDGTFKESLILRVGTAPASVVMEDISGDGALDIIIANIESNDVTVIISNP